MKAAVMTGYGGPEVLEVTDVPDPEVRPGDVLVRVHAAAVNPVDYKIRLGSQRAINRIKLPWILGMDVSGVVEQVGEKVTDFAVGDEVFSSPTHRRPGTYAELVAIDASEVARKPTNVTHVEAASLPLVGLTAWDCLVGAASVAPDDKVLIQAGAGGVGSIAIQLAKKLGAHVATTCSTKNVSFLTELGVDEVIDYTEVRFEDELKDYDVVLESMGGDIYKRSLRVLRRGGRLASINSGLPRAVEKYGPLFGVLGVGLRILGSKIAARVVRGVKISMVVRKASGANLAKLGAMVEEGAIRPIIAEVFSLAQIADAHRAVESGRSRGKNVIHVLGATE